MPPPNLTILRQYASKKNPAALPPSVLFSHTPRTLTIFDCYPKALFHFLILPRPTPALSVFDLASLRTLLHADRAQAHTTLLGLRDEAAALRTTIRGEMQRRFGCTWDVWAGFHAVQSMEHMHLHVISADLCSERLKSKKHYNSFHPRLGFFLHLDTVLEWFDAEPSYYDTMSALRKAEYEPLLKERLACHHCEKAFTNMPALKAHLQEEFDALRARARKSASPTKRKREVSESAEDEHGADSVGSESGDDVAPQAKKPATGL